MANPLQHTLLSCCARSLRGSSSASYTQDLGLFLQATKARVARPSGSQASLHKASIRSFASAQRPIATLGHAARLPIPSSSRVAKSLPSWPTGRNGSGRRCQSTTTSPDLAWNTSALPIKSSSSSSTSDYKLPTLTSPAVSTHLFIIAGLVFSIVVVGGLTRLTESGLSITEWNLVTGTLPPLSQEAWQSEYAKYMVTPEGTLMNKDMTLDDFKRIYGWEWGHRFLGRIIGLAFLAPIPYFLIKRKASKKTAAMLFGIAALIGGQGALGWYMVKSGITTEAIQARDGVPRVSQYRLAAHLGMAFLVYALSLRHALAVRRDWNLAKLGKSIAGVQGSALDSMRLLSTREARRLRYMVNSLTGMVFFTAISGASVASVNDPLLTVSEQAHLLLDWMLVSSTIPSHIWVTLSCRRSPSSTRTNTRVHPINRISSYAIRSKTLPQFSSTIEYWQSLHSVRFSGYSCMPADRRWQLTSLLKR